MSDIEGTPRRRLLKKGALLLGGLAGLSLAARPAITAGTSSPAEGVITVRITGSGWQMTYPDRKRGVLPGQGQRSASFGQLHSAESGQKIGEFYASSFQFGAPFGPSQVAAGAMETHQFNLSDGTIVGIGTVADVFGSESVHAIIGGTGRYEGASGSYIARQNPIEAGGDGTAEFQFTIITRSA